MHHILVAQDLPFADEIKAYKKQDSIAFPPRKAILFIGSSSIRMWKSLESDFPRYKVINRGFGGSGLAHITAYANEIIFPYKPKQIVIYSGENDFVVTPDATPELIAAQFKTLFSTIRKTNRRVRIVYVSMKPSPRRKELMPAFMTANLMIKEFMAEQRRADFVNVYDAMVDEHGNPRQELFTQDSLHMNANGYAIWKKIIEPYLKK